MIKKHLDRLTPSLHSLRKIHNRQIIKYYRNFLRTFGYTRLLSRFLFKITQYGIYIASFLFVLDLLYTLFINEFKLGEFGDFLGGTLNPIFTFLMLLGLIATIVLQKKELSLARKEFSRSARALELQYENLKQQGFDSSYFKMLEYFDAHREEISAYTKSPQMQELFGRDAYDQILTNFVRDYLIQEINNLVPQLIDNDENEEELRGKAFLKSYDRFKHSVQYNRFNLYYSSLTSMLKLIEKYRNTIDTDLYIDLIKTRLCDAELALFLYYCKSQINPNSPLPDLIKKYKIFNDFDIRKMKHMEHEALNGLEEKWLDYYNSH